MYHPESRLRAFANNCMNDHVEIPSSEIFIYAAQSSAVISTSAGKVKGVLLISSAFFNAAVWA